MAANVPPRASSVWPEMPFMRGPVGAQRLREWLGIQREIRTKTAERRARVLVYPWACKRLCLILNIKDAKFWNGFIPPLHDDQGLATVNRVRSDLIALLKDVEAADREAAG